MNKRSKLSFVILVFVVIIQCCAIMLFKNETVYAYDNKIETNPENVTTSSSVTINEKLDTPTNITATVTTSASVTVTWDAVTDAINYDVELDGVVTEDIIGEKYVFNDIELNTSHTIRVKAKNNETTSEWSTPINVCTEFKTPENFIVKATKNALTASWNPVDGAVGYDIEIDGNIIDNGTLTTYKSGGLKTGDTHTYRVRVRNGYGKSDWTKLVSQKVVNYTSLSGDVTKECTLMPEDGPYVVTGTFIVKKDATLNIMPGTIIKFDPAAEFSVYGKVNAIGTQQKKIVFTTTKDFLYGGSGVISKKDYWKGITVGGEFNGQNVSVKYGYSTYRTTANGTYGFGIGNAIYVDGTLNLINSEVTNSFDQGVRAGSCAELNIDSTQISRSGEYGIYAEKDDFIGGTSIIKITNSTISSGGSGGIYIDDPVNNDDITIDNNSIKSNKGYGININQCSTETISVKNNDIENNKGYPVYVNCKKLKHSIFGQIINNTFKGNIYGGDAVDAVSFGGTISIDATIPNSNSKYIYTGGRIAEGTTLTIQPGVVIEFYPVQMMGSSLYIDGTLKALGKSGQPIVFTTVNDPIYGGTGVNSSDDKWGGIYVCSKGNFDADNIKVMNVGSGITPMYSVAFYVDGRFSLINSEIVNCYGTGIAFNTSIQPKIMFDTFDCSYKDITNVNDKITIYAIYNYWGSTKGPSDGDKTSGGVNADPWLGNANSNHINTGKTDKGTNNANDTLFSNIHALSLLADNYADNTTLKSNQLVMMYIRQFNNSYTSNTWDIVAGKIDNNFIDYIRQESPSLEQYFSGNLNIIDPKSSEEIEITHFAATLGGLLYPTSWKDGTSFIKKMESQFMPESHLNNLCGWAGDLQTLMVQMKEKTNDSCDHDIVYNETKNAIGDSDYSFSMTDLLADVDAVNINSLLETSSISLDSALRDYYGSGVNTRYSNFVQNIAGSTNKDDFKQWVSYYTCGSYYGIGWPLFEGKFFYENQNFGSKDAFVDYIWEKMQN